MVCEIYGKIDFFANCSGLEVSADMQLRGVRKIERGDPHTGAIRPTEETGATDHGQSVGRLLAPLRQSPLCLMVL
jgi:hypothetical protein